PGVRRALHPVRCRCAGQWGGQAGRPLTGVRRRGRDSPHLHVSHSLQRGRCSPRVERGSRPAPALTRKASRLVDASGGLVLWILAVGLAVVGVIGTVVPGLPGGCRVFAGRVLWAWMDGFARVGVKTLAALAALTVAAYALDLVATAVGVRRFGTSWWGALGAVLGTLVGLVFGLPGLVLGPFL